ncbi:hypothetical protein SEVIR_4G301300v4 [Setaria viridis]|uniref:Cgi-62 n=2 Tax=Setaria TaxID=4554 RepID=A0A368QZC9_SETIT|nr:uncharacterized protein At2g02148 isoform X1 [Setaria italica]XP_034590731.1 uncharacterized protein At2g02148 isoform X1 [Setaria viridis]RCV23307.1 hypothetical protein SETIT_4G289000v2 [Setaria italica]TKW23585.1 hypothetical protein SEVIR_4G301300v2 [Setaria viridis]
MRGRGYDAGFLGDDVDPEAITNDDAGRRGDSLVAADSSSVDCMHGSCSSSLSLHGVRVDDEQSALDNSSRPSSPFDILTPQDVLPIEMARSRFLDLVVDYFISEHVVETVECSSSDFSQVDDKSSKRKQQGVRYEGDPMIALPLMYIANLYETLVSDVNVRLASLIGFREKSIGLALEASGGLYRKLIQRFPKKGPCSFKRRELATSHSTRTKFPELVVQEEKRVRFVVINGLAIIERPDNMRMEDAEWFKRLTGRSEVAICSRDYKFYSPRHKFRRSPQAAFDIPETSIQNQHQSTSKRHIEQLENQPYLHLFHQSEDDTIQQVQHCTQFPPVHQCTSAPHLSDNPQNQQQAYLSQHISCLQVGQGHLGGRMHIIPTSPAKFCDECGSPYLRATSKFCSECGTKRLGM